MKIHHICLQTDDYQKSLDFYINILNFELIEETPDFHGRHYNSWLRLGDFMIELQTNKVNESLSEFDKSSKGIVHFCLYTENLEEELRRIEETGFSHFILKWDSPIYSVNGGKLLKMKAPEGTIIELRNTLDI
jgi:glyoxylase I family protein